MPVKLPICNFDARTGILCSNCESKLRAGVITRADIEASRALVTLAERGARLSGAELSRAFEVGGSYVLEFGGASFHSVRDEQELQPRLESILKGRVWMVESGSSHRKFLEDLLYPVRVLTVNTVWLPDGTKRTKVIVPGRWTERQVADFDKLRAVARKVRGLELLVETEREALLRVEH